jgi:hypothetical protein
MNDGSIGLKQADINGDASLKTLKLSQNTAQSEDLEKLPANGPAIKE